MITLSDLQYSIYFLIVVFFPNYIFGQVVWKAHFGTLYTQSSPRCIDLTQDGVLDVVIGLSEGNNVGGRVQAYEGKTGSLIWDCNLDASIFGSAVFWDITEDGIPDVFIGGRSTTFVAINGKTGEVIWKFDVKAKPKKRKFSTNWKMFYNAQLVPDQNNDLVPDLLVTNGGQEDSAAFSKSRPTGYIMILSGKTGQILGYHPNPDFAETYCSPVYAYNNGEHEVYWGTGGETHPGALWRTTLKNILEGKPENAQRIINHARKGFVSPPVFVDLNKDNVLDIVATALGGVCYAIDGKTQKELWSKDFGKVETYSIPAPGLYFDSTRTDLFFNYGRGSFVEGFQHHIQTVLNGTTGEILFQDSIDAVIISSPVTANIFQHPFHTVFLKYNLRDTDVPANHGIKMYCFNGKNPYSEVLDLPTGGAGHFSTLWVGDLDGDKNLDLLSAMRLDSWYLIRMEVAYKLKNPPTWGAYHGSLYDGVYREKIR